MAPEIAVGGLPFTQLGLVELYLIFAMRKLSVVVDLARSLKPQRFKRSAEERKFCNLHDQMVNNAFIIFALKYQDNFQRDDLPSSNSSSQKTRYFLGRSSLGPAQFDRRSTLIDSVRRRRRLGSA
jgi:hypothetical protein